MRVIAIVGPTASGKTALGIHLAQALGGEVVSADSRQVYRGLDLGTGKVTLEEAEGVPHYLIDVADPWTTYTVHDFVTAGRAAIADIDARGKVPVVVGGSGLYVDALLGRRTLDTPEHEPTLRARLSSYTLETQLAKLKQVAPDAYEKVDRKNPRRVQRALEIALSECAPRSLPDAPYSVVWIGLTLERDVLKKRIHDRLRARLAAGMLDEARALRAHGLTYERMHELGLEYRSMARHLQGQITYDEMIAQLDSEIYKYAKRQMTWFKRNKEIKWCNSCEPNFLEQALAAA